MLPLLLLQFMISLSKASDQCLLPMNPGKPCQAKESRYFFHLKTKQCEKFSYGGCSGNANNFKDILDCTSTCIHHMVPLGNFVPGLDVFQSRDNVIGDTVEKTIGFNYNICKLPPMDDTLTVCRASIKRWTFDST